MNLSEAQEKWLHWLHQRGGSGYLDRYGRLVAAGELSAQGAQLAWLNLVSKGFLGGAGDRLFITTAGRRQCGEVPCTCLEGHGADYCVVHAA